MIDIKTEKDKIAIVVVGYNKLRGLERLLSSLNSAIYEENDIPLVISVDASGNQDVYCCANCFEWKHGKKYVNIEDERLGLKNHIFQCASYSRFFKGVVILEDDLMVSPYYFNYVKMALNKYEDNNNVAGIALYSPEINGYLTLPFQPVQNGYDVFAWQTVCSWGQVWNERMWNDFWVWLNNWKEDFSDIDMPERIKGWKRAWSKYFYAYMIKNNKYFIYPYLALSTNFNDEGGEHGGGDKSIVQVSLLQGHKEYQMGDIENLVHYDVFSQNMRIPEWLGIKSSELTIDFYGMKSNYNRYVLAPFKLPYKKIRGFSLSLRPWELNIKNNIGGNDIFLYDREISNLTKAPRKRYIKEMGNYFLRGFDLRLLLIYIRITYIGIFKLGCKRFFQLLRF